MKTFFVISSEMQWSREILYERKQYNQMISPLRSK